MNYTHLKEIAEPSARYLFIDDEGVTEALIISGVETDTFLLYHPNIAARTKRSGYFVAASGKGIVRFSGELQKISESREEPFSLYRLKVDMPSLTLVDRRESVRKKPVKSVSMSFSYEGKPLKADLLDFSEKGMRLALTKRVPKNVIFQFELKLPPNNGEPIHFETDGLVVYCEPEDDPQVLMTGISFIVPHFLSEDDKKKYQINREKLAKYV